jgi:glycerol-1-phosphate dehydrogenase [NAD(P)+]
MMEVSNNSTNDILSRIKQNTEALHPATKGNIDIDEIRIEAGALCRAAQYIAQKAYSCVIVVADATTYESAGKQLYNHLVTAGVNVNVTVIIPNRTGDVLADEASVIQLLLDVQKASAELVIAVGGGTIHDITRYCAYTASIPFISVPTAPSVDGFNSKGAPIITRGVKVTIPAIGPDAIFADLDVLVQAPPTLVAAGFGDMLGKYTSLFDWDFGAKIADEPYLLASAEITQRALTRCVHQAEQIARRDAEGIHTLMTSLIESGLAMLLFGQSHPASGSEHHLSHYWEMAYLRQGKRQLLHGAKVGVACIEISKLYHRLAAEGPQRWAYTPHIGEHWSTITKHIMQIPNAQKLGELLKQVGGPVTIEQLGVDPQLLERSLNEGHLVRTSRYTLLRAYNELNLAQRIT